MIDTVQNMAVEAKVDESAIRANLSYWKRLGEARGTGNYMRRWAVGRTKRKQRLIELWWVRDTRWAAYVKEQRRRQRLDGRPKIVHLRAGELLHLVPHVYLSKAKARWRQHVRSLEASWRRVQRGCYVLRNRFVVTE